MKCESCKEKRWNMPQLLFKFYFYCSTMGQIYRATQILKDTKDKDFAMEIIRAINLYSESFSMRFFVHYALFRNVVNMLGNEEQQRRYIDDIDNFRIFGCFAMVT